MRIIYSATASSLSKASHRQIPKHVHQSQVLHQNDSFSAVMVVSYYACTYILTFEQLQAELFVDD